MALQAFGRVLRGRNKYWLPIPSLPASVRIKLLLAAFAVIIAKVLDGVNDDPTIESLSSLRSVAGHSRTTGK